jgi:hypothetical protein
MCDGKRGGKDVVMMLGFFFLAVANVGGWWLQRYSGWTENLVDGTSGFLMGVAIATMCWGIVRQARANPRSPR